jgi:hypothetical protein
VGGIYGQGLVSSNASKIVDTASSAASHFTRRTVGNQVAELREAGEKILRSAWWWSLAAIGIYGFASALPGEVRRYLSDEDEKTKEKEVKTTEINDDPVDQKSRHSGEIFQAWKSWVNGLGKTGDG